MLAVNWNPVQGREASGRFAALLLDGLDPFQPSTPGYVTATLEAAGQGAMQAAFSAEKCLVAASLVPAPSADIAAQMLVEGTPTLTGAGASTFGGNAAIAVAALKGFDVKTGNATPDQACALHYLALQRAIREAANSSRPFKGDPDVALVAPGFVDAAFVVGALVLVGVLGAAAIAAYAWIKHDESIELAKQATAIELGKARILAQAKLAADLAAQARAAGQPVDVPSVIASLGGDELREARAFPWLVGVVALVATIGGVVAFMKRKAIRGKLSDAIAGKAVVA